MKTETERERTVTPKGYRIVTPTYGRDYPPSHETPINGYDTETQDGESGWVSAEQFEQDKISMPNYDFYRRRKQT